MTLLEHLPYWGNPLAFTNGLVQPKRLAYRLVADSNLDWGQNDDRVRELLQGDPGRALNPLHIVPGRNVIAANLLAGVAQPERFAWARAHLRPIDHIRHTHMVFDVTPEQFAAFLDAEYRFETRPLDRSLCPEGYHRELIREASPARFETAYGQLPLLCFIAQQTADVTLTATAGVDSYHAGRTSSEERPPHPGRGAALFPPHSWPSCLPCWTVQGILGGMGRHRAGRSGRRAARLGRAGRLLKRGGLRLR